MSVSLAALLIPELRWNPTAGFDYLGDAIDDYLAMGVGGFVIRNGPRDVVLALAERLQRDAKHPLLIAASAERGAGETIAGATGIPPLAAFGALRDEDAIRRAARVTARELRSAGINWALAPCLDLAVEPQNPMLGSRSFGADPQKVAEWGVAWIDACQAEGVMATAMHLPGLGRLLRDPALEPAGVDASGAGLWGTDLVPFRAAVDAGVATVLVSQVSYPRLAGSALPAAQSPVLLHEMMRGELQYEGLLVADLPAQAAARVSGDEAQVSVASVAAGCDLVLAAQDVGGVADALDAAQAQELLEPDRVESALRRRAFWADWGRAGPGREATLEDVLWTRKVADTVVHALRGVFANIGPVVDVLLVDDDADGARPGGEQRLAPFLATLRAMGLGPRMVDGPTEEGRGAMVIAVLGEPATGRGRWGYTEATRQRIARAVADARAARRSVVAVLFGPPMLAEEVPEVPNVVCAWAGDRAMQEAAARRLA